jgi:mRNA interferase MazF
MNHHKFDIVAVEFPFIENSKITKVRPAVIVSSDEYNKNTGFIVIAMITSATNSKLWSDVKINDWQSLQLSHSSFIRMKFANVVKGSVLHKMGQLSKIDQKPLQKTLRDIFD